MIGILGADVLAFLVLSYLQAKLNGMGLAYFLYDFI
jgi:hypothetical protein